MRYLLDTNILLRSVEVTSTDHAAAIAAIHALAANRDEILLIPQTIVEFWAASTRPTGATNGLGFSLDDTRDAVNRFLQDFTLLEDNAAVFSRWLQLVVDQRVSGRQVHDARIAAAMLVHGVSHILTFNTPDFVRYPGITPVHPSDLLPAATP